MFLVCKTCDQSLFPNLQSYHKITKKLVKSHHNTHRPEYLAFRKTGRGLAKYVETLKKELDLANEALEATRILSAPISKIPNEILIRIFEEVSSLSESVPASYGIQHLRSPSLTCKRWRIIIISTPKFWTRISLPSYGLSLPPGTQKRLRRAGVMPLVLSITNLYGLSQRSFKLLGTPFNRVASLQIDLDEGEEVEDNIFASCRLLPSVKRLTLQMHFDPTPENDPSVYFGSDSDGYYSEPDTPEAPPISIVLSNQQAPQLTSIDIFVEYPLEQLSLPWAQLTTLKLHTTDALDFDPTLVLAQLSNIEKLDIRFELGIYPTLLPNDISTIIFPRLRSFLLSSSVPNDGILDLLRYAQFPSLQELVIRGICNQQRLAESLSSPQLWSITSLSLSFALHGANTLAQEPVESLKEFKQLESFQWNVPSGHHLVTGILGEMTADSVGILFPHLESLEIQAFRHENLNMLEQLFQKRVSSIDVSVPDRKPLRKVLVSCWTGYHGGFSTRPWMSEPSATLKPPRYNDRTTCVKLTGNFPPTFLQ